MDFSISDLEEVETLVSQGYSAQHIALVYDVQVSLFLIWCLDDGHPVGKAYQKGLIEIEKKKNNLLIAKVDSGSETAIQILIQS